MQQQLWTVIVLVVDFDSQATFGHSMGLSDVGDDHTVWGIMARGLERETERWNPHGTVRGWKPGSGPKNDALAQEHVWLKQAGLITDLIPLDAIDSGKLVRDRAAGPDDELRETGDLDPRDWPFQSDLDRTGGRGAL